MMNITPPQNPYWPFFMLTGVTFVSFASGFGVCLFDLDQVDACVTHADQWVEKFRETGDHMLRWGVKVVHTILDRHPVS